MSVVGAGRVFVRLDRRKRRFDGRRCTVHAGRAHVDAARTTATACVDGISRGRAFGVCFVNLTARHSEGSGIYDKAAAAREAVDRATELAKVAKIKAEREVRTSLLEWRAVCCC